MPGRKHRFTAKEDRQAEHIADSEGGGKEGLSIGYATINARKKSKRKKSHRRATGKLRTRKKK
jgi:hypothetical protein